MAKISAKTLRILTTCNFYLCFITLGLLIAVPGPTLLDLQHLVNTEITQIAFIYTARSGGYMMGSLIGGIIFDLVKAKPTILTVCSFVCTVTTFCIPWSRSLGALTGFMVINGYSMGHLDTGCNVCCLTLWGKDSGPFFQALHFTFGLGGLIAPLIAAPFLGDYSSELGDLRNSSNFTMSTDMLLPQNTSQPPITYIPKITYTYSIIGCFSLLTSVNFLILCIMSTTEVSGPKSEEKKTRERSVGLVLLLVVLNVSLFFVETGVEIAYAQMLTSYAVKGRLKLTATVGSFMTSTFWGAFTASRFISVFLAIKLSNFTMIVSDIVVTSIGALILIIFANYEWSLWVSSVLLGMGIASFFPSAIGWLDTYINVTNKIASVFVVGAATGEMVIPFAISYYIETLPDVLLYVVPASCAFSATLVFVLYTILRNKDTKFITEEPSCNVISGAHIK